MLILSSPESVFTSPSRIHSVHPILIRSVNVVFDRCSRLTCLTVVNSRERRRCDPTMRIAVATIDTSLLTDHWSGPGMTHADDDIDLFVWDILTLDWWTALWTRVDIILISWILVNTDFIGDQEQPYNFYPEEDSRSNSCFRYETGPERDYPGVDEALILLNYSSYVTITFAVFIKNHEWFLWCWMCVRTLFRSWKVKLQSNSLGCAENIDYVREEATHDQLIIADISRHSDTADTDTPPDTSDSVTQILLTVNMTQWRDITWPPDAVLIRGRRCSSEVSELSAEAATLTQPRCEAGNIDQHRPGQWE